MIIKLSQSSTDMALKHLVKWFAQQDVEARQINWGAQVLLVTSSKWKGDADYLKSIDGVESVTEMTADYQLCTRKFQPQDTVIDLGDGVIFGRGATVMMAGPCAVESEDQVMRTAEFLRSKFDIKVFRAGAFKPRTSPYTFQGLADEGLNLLAKVRKEFGMKIITEVKDTTHLAAVADVADIIQIGTKAMYNFSLLAMCGQLKQPIVLKRGFMTTIKEFLQAADFILSSGNSKVILCERGIRSFEPQTRFCLDVCSAALIKELSHLPIVLDPSHAMGIAAQVPLVAQSAAALGVDGLLIETHPDPANAKSDKEQALSFEEFGRIVPVLDKICTAVGRRLIA
ncbi:3-deoxy-7-phosphoheptulonate synthase [Halomicronema hongdechloris C2206]|uniref:3-deoxy-7-phosphoheptulonate synthase n=1 Tax=Halomicronema hongdechloris C2206 TaxID=1641165 RepID=A0A1Z3HJI8_9CYAN|nr:3-deoxy-7-phosphoheptulonate synthase [Halomicronema hongdechloris]ASC70436.1 3-deoxy-7-phosphoheptulonate synthase [Halomicronema hongdechloris C2206]